MNTTPKKSTLKHAYVLNVMSDDHPGIIAAVTGVVDSLGGNINSCSQTVLGGYFTLIMIASLPEAIDPDELAQKITDANHSSSDFRVMVGKVMETKPSAPTNSIERFVMTVFGPDRPGIVERFSQYMAGKDINIVDLYGDSKDDNFVLICQVDIPRDRNIGLLQADLEHLGKEIGLTVKLQHENVFVATNQLRLSRLGT